MCEGLPGPEPGLPATLPAPRNELQLSVYFIPFFSSWRRVLAARIHLRASRICWLQVISKDRREGERERAREIGRQWQREEREREKEIWAPVQGAGDV